MCEHETKLRTALTAQFGENASRHFSVMHAPSANLGGKTPLEHVSNGGCLTSAVQAIRPTAMGG